MSFKFKYSLIVPHYNDVYRLKRLLSSLPVRDDLQVLVIDDCSPDQHSLNKFKNKFSDVTYLSTPTNKGAGAARNIGLQHIKGEFIVFADADDEFLPGAFEVFDENVSSDIDVTYFLAEAWQEESGQPSVRADSLNQLCNSYLKEPSEQDLQKLKLAHCVPWAKVYKKEFIESTNIKFDETFVSNDIYFNVVNAVLAKNIAVFSEKVYKVYRLSDSLTSTTTSERLIERVEVSAKLAGKLKDLGIKEKRSASGYILDSLNYGISTFLKVLYISIRSDMQLNLFRVFQPQRWLAFFRRKKQLDLEKNTK